MLCYTEELYETFTLDLIWCGVDDEPIVCAGAAGKMSETDEAGGYVTGELSRWIPDERWFLCDTSGGTGGSNGWIEWHRSRPRAWRGREPEWWGRRKHIRDVSGGGERSSPEPRATVRAGADRPG